MANGNVKISELTKHKLSEMNGEEMIPMSWSEDGSSSYESYKVYVKDIVSYVGQHAPQVSYLERDLGQYAGTLDGNFCDYHTKTLTVATSNAGITTAGAQVSASGWCITNGVQVEEGTLYLFKVGAGFTLPSGRVMFAKKHEHTYYPIIGYEDKTITITHEDGTVETITVREPVYGPAQTEVVYEPRSYHYESNSDHAGYGIPASGYVVFLAPEDEEIVLSVPTDTLNADPHLYAVHYGIFSEIAEKFLGTDSDMSKVISEAIAALEGRISSLEHDAEDESVNQMVSMKMPQFRGNDLIVIADHAPSATEYYVDQWGGYSASTTAYKHAADLPRFDGQIWIYSSGSTMNAWMGFGVSNSGTPTWKQISLS